MRRIFCVLFLAFVYTISIKAQLPDGTVAPDFTIVDINGNSHSLYQYLDEGNIVLLDIFATWCQPCWSYHEAHTLENAWRALGPEGADRLMVIGIEGDPSTSASSIWTGAGTSIGDWTEGVTYPIVDNTDVANLLELISYPTIYKVCPDDKTIYRVNQLELSEIFDQVFDGECGDAALSTDLGFSYTVSNETKLCIGESTELSIETTNFGTETIQQYGVKVYNSANTLVAQSPLINNHISFDSKTIDLGTYTTTGDDELTYVIDFMDDDQSNNTKTIAVNTVNTAIGNVVNLELKTDFYGFETYWEIRDYNETIIASGGNDVVGPLGGGANTADSDNPNAYESFETYNYVIELPTSNFDCYQFIITDDNDDGMCCGDGTGYYQLTDDSGNMIFSGGQFTTEQIELFGAGGIVATKDIESIDNLEVYPNPVTDELTIAFEMKKSNDLEISVLNILGQQVHSLGMDTYTSGEQSITFDVNQLQAGIYFVALKNETGISSRKFTVAK